MRRMSSGEARDRMQAITVLSLVALLALSGCAAEQVDREEMRKARSAIELCDAMLAKGQTTIQACLEMRQRYEEKFGRRY